MHSTQQQIASEQSVRAGNHIKLEACGCEKEFFAMMVVDAVMALGEASHLEMIGIKKVKILLRLLNSPSLF
jgi:hypothetical protein